MEMGHASKDSQKVISEILVHLLLTMRGEKAIVLAFDCGPLNRLHCMSALSCFCVDTRWFPRYMYTYICVCICERERQDSPLPCAPPGCDLVSHLFGVFL